MSLLIYYILLQSNGQTDNEKKTDRKNAFNCKTILKGQTIYILFQFKLYQSN